MKKTQKTQTALDILDDEIKGDIQAALKKMHDDYSMTWVYKTHKTKELFPTTPKNIKKMMSAVYHIKGRSYDIKNVSEGKDVVMIELVESYPDPKTRKVYRTPLVLVLEFKKGKIITGRHYCDPQIPYLHLSKKQINKIYK
jgi:ketosteroid isomerase-like protein